MGSIAELKELILKMGSEYCSEMSQLNGTQTTLGEPYTTLKGPWPEESKQTRVKKRCNLRTIRIIVGILASVTVIVGTTFGIIRSVKKPIDNQPCTGENCQTHCMAGWTEHRFGSKKKCFKNIGKYRVDQAKQKCAQLGAALPLPRSDREQADLVATLESLDVSSEIVLDGFERDTNYWVDSLGIKLTYFAWSEFEPNRPMKERFMVMKFSKNEGLWRNELESLETNVVCVKCSEWYAIPDGYECHDTDFGTVVVKVWFYSTFCQ